MREHPDAANAGAVRTAPIKRRRLGGLLGMMIASCVLAGGCGVPGAQGPATTFGLDFSLPEGSRTGGAIVFLMDGVNAKIFERMLDAGELPAVKKYFVDRGLYAPRAVANTPSITLANLTSIVTGVFPGHHGIVANNWFDRNRLLLRDYETIAQKNKLDEDYRVANLYEQFPSGLTCSIFYQPHRGATKFIENWTSAGPPFGLGWYEFVDRLTLSRFDIVMDIARKRRQFPAVTFVYLLAADFRGYEKGVRSEAYRRAIRHTDFQIGRVLGDLERAGLLAETLITLVGDHGLEVVDRHFPLDDALEKIGLSLPTGRLWEKTPFEKRFAYYRKFAAVLTGGGDRHYSIMLRRSGLNAAGGLTFESWPVRPTAAELMAYPVGTSSRFSGDPAGACRSPSVIPRRVNLPAVLSAEQAVDAVAWKVGDNRVRVRTGLGEVEFRQPAGRGGDISYHVSAGEDPLGWREALGRDAPGGVAMSQRAWLRATVRTDYPDLPAQILAYFRARRAGDIAVFAAPGWDLARKNRAGHGGLRPADVHVPLLLAGPGVPRGRIDVARTVDIVPTLLKLLGKDIPPALDGQVLIAPVQD